MFFVTFDKFIRISNKAYIPKSFLGNHNKPVLRLYFIATVQYLKSVRESSNVK